jgi:RNA polymerase sigma-70 factor (ECF subfamily)
MTDMPLSRTFLAHAPPGTWPPEPELSAILARLLDEARRAWPAFDLSPEAFVRHLAERSAVGGALGEVHAADLYLACALAEGAPGAIEAFEREHMPRLGQQLVRLRPSASFVDEVAQILRERLFVRREGVAPKIGEYGGRGALTSWLHVVAVRAALDLRKAPAALVVDAGEVADDRREAASQDPELGYIQQRYREVFNRAFRHAVATLPADQRELLRMHFVEGKTLDEMAAHLGVHRATVARRIAAARQAAGEEARRFLTAQLGATEDELRSLLGVMQSQVDVSLAGVLAAGG